MVSVLYQWLVAASLFLPGLTDSRNIVPDSHVRVKSHPFYIAVTEVNQNAKDQVLEVSCKMFADDLEEILEKNYKTTLDISLEKDQVVFNRLIADYIEKHLTIVVDGKISRLKYVGFEKEKESAYCYFEIAGIVNPKKIDITNQILYDFNNAQINIIHITVNGNRKSIKLNYPEKDASFGF